jgi:hypothetical protein
MGAFGAKVAQVTIQSDWWSKINWTQVVAVACSAITVFAGNQMEVSPATQAQIVLTIQALSGILTVWFKRQDTTITPTAAAKLEQTR